MAELLDKWDVVNKLIRIENQYQFYKEKWDADVLYRRICELEVGLGKTPGVVLVHCKECVRYNTSGFAAGFGWCEAWDSGRMDNDFCSHGTKVDGAELEEKAKPTQEVDFDYNAED